jgi:mediator of RNA polymerase II transcription subunit 12
MQSIVAKLRQLLVQLILHHKECMIFPRTWHRFKHIVNSIPTNSDNQEIQAAVHRVSSRNDRLTIPIDPRTRKYANPTKQALNLLDTTRVDGSIARLLQSLLDLDLELSRLVHTILRWAASRYRLGRHRTYVATRLLRKLIADGRDIDSLVWTYIKTVDQDSTISRLDIFRVIGELARTGDFSVAHFLQHIISVGALYEQLEGSTSRSPLIDLLVHIPTHNLPHGTASLREILLNSTAFNQTAEDDQVTNFQDTVTSHIQALGKPGASRSLDFCKFSSRLTLNRIYELGFWLRALFVSSRDRRSSELYGAQASASASSVFYVVRCALEEFQDYPCLADVLGMSMDSDDQQLLTSITDTLHFGHEAFKGLGAMKKLFDSLIDRYESLRNQQLISKEFCSALLDLCSTLEADSSILSLLMQDIERCNQLGVAAMCSPASDNLEFINSIADPDDEIERILSSGTTMDERMISRVFNRIVAKTDGLEKRDSQCQLSLGSQLFRLRSFDAVLFDTLLSTWLSDLMSQMDNLVGLFHVILPAVVGSGCLAVESFVQITRKVIDRLETEATPGQFRLQLDLVKALLPDMGSTSSPEMYKYRLACRNYCLASGANLMDQIRQMMELASHSQGSDDEKSVIQLLNSPGLRLSIMAHLLDPGADDAATEIENILNASAPEMAMSLAEKLFDPEGSTGILDLDLKDKISAVFAHADELSLPFCLVELHAILGHAVAEDDQVAQAFFDSITTSEPSIREMILDILGGLDSARKRKIGEISESRIFSIIDQPTSNGLAMVSETGRLITASLETFDLTAQELSPDIDSAALSLLLEKLRGLLENLMIQNPSEISAAAPTLSQR